ncbi:putative reverse transcriptase domain-containing protein [Tanacetum coccineum]
MSDSEDSTVTYTEVSSPFEDLSDIGSPGVDGLPMMPEDPYAYVVAAFQAPPSPDYVPGPEEPEQAPPSIDFVPEPVYPEFMPPEDEVFPAEEQPLPAAVSPTTDSPGYIADSDPEEDPEEDPADYPADGGDDDDDDDESSDDDEDDDDDVEEDEDEDEEEEQCTSFEVVRLLPIPTLLPSPLSSLSSPLTLILSPLPQILSPPLHVSSSSLPDSLTYPLGYRAAMIQLRAETPSTSHLLSSSTPPSGTPPLLPIPLPTPSPPMLLPSTVCRAGVFEVTLPPWKRLCIALGSRYEVSESSSAPTARPTGGFRADYGFVGTLDDEIRRDPERYVGYGITYTWDEMDTYEIYVRLDDAQVERLLMSGQLNMLRRDRRAYARTARLMETEARLSHEAWVQSMDASGTAHSEARDVLTEAEMCEDSHDSGTGVRRQAHLARECTYLDFMKCKPLYFKGTERVVELTQWFERMETVFRIRNCPVENQIKFSTCTLLGSALTWWNSHVKTIGHDVAYAMTWKNLKKKMTDKYCPRGKVKKLEGEMWNLKVKGTDLVSYNQRFQELALMYARMFPEESDKIEKYVSGLPDMINERSGEKKPYGGSKPLCLKCNYYHDGQCAPKCHKCNRVGHLARDCRSTTNVNTANNQKGTLGSSRKLLPMNVESQGHFKRDCPQKRKIKTWCSAPIMALPEGSEDFIIYYDTSIKGLGVVLMQREKVIAYALRQLKIHEKNYYGLHEFE